MGKNPCISKNQEEQDQEGHIIMDFSIYDAVRAGFKKVIFIIKKENEQDFRDAIGDRLSDKVEIVYVHQDLNNIPEGFQVPEGRVKPWGTGHAIMSCIDVIDGFPDPGPGGHRTCPVYDGRLPS